MGAPQKEKKIRGPMGTCPVCPLVKTALDLEEERAEAAPPLPPFGRRTDAGTVLLISDICTFGHVS